MGYMGLCSVGVLLGLHRGYMGAMQRLYEVM